MKRHVGAFEAKTHLPKLLEEVLQGGRITITKRGEPVAELIPVAPAREKDVSTVIADLRTWRRGITWGDKMSTQSAKKIGRK